jgi:lipopolysaccharide export system permease protein
VSISRIVLAAFKGGAVLALVAVAIGEGIVPSAEEKALQLRSEAQSGRVTLKTQHGFWARDASAYINIREILPGAGLRDISIYELGDEQRLVLATHAREARYEDGSWILRGISRSRISDERVDVLPLEQTSWDSLLDPALLRVVVVEPHALPIWALLRYVRFMAESGQDPGDYEMTMWSKIVHPLLILTMIFMSIPILFGSARSTGTGIRVFIGVMVGIGFYLVSRSFTYLALLYGLSAWLAAAAPPLLFAVGGLLVLRRVG